MSDRLNGREYWRSLEDLAGSEAVAKRQQTEFPGYDPNEIVAMPRRKFLKLTAASMAVAGLTGTGCRRWPTEHLVPSTAGLRDQLPGEPEFYATAFEKNGVADSLLVTAVDGRPIKIEGNPLHPLFATWWDKDGKPIAAASDACAQASLLEMYDPARSRRVIAKSNTEKPDISNWDAFFAAFEAVAANSQGDNLAVLSEVCSGVSHAAAKKAFKARFPRATWVEFEPLAADAELEAGQLAFDKAVRPIYHLDQAKTIVSLDCDLFGTHPNKVRHSSDWAKGRRSADAAERTMNRVYVAETTFTGTGAAADERLPCRPSALKAIVAGLAAAAGVSGVSAPAELTEAQKKWIAAAAADLKNGGVVAVGSHVAAQVQALAHAINFSMNSVGTAVTYHELPEAAPQTAALRTLVDRMTADQIGGLIILGGNPVYNAPTDLDFAGALKHVRFTAHLGLYPDETSHACQWHLPKSHYLESWGDARAYDGSVLLQQPLILPLYDSRSPIELVASLAKAEQTDGMAIVRSSVATLEGAATNDGWQQSLHDGFVKGTAYPAATGLTPNAVGSPMGGGNPGELEIRFVESALYDGRYANNAWLQEAPDPITKLVWDNAALMNKTDADKLGLVDGDLININISGNDLDIPVYVLWGQPRGVITLPLGYGRTAAGPIGGESYGENTTDPVGFDVYKIRRTVSMFAATIGVTVTKGDGSHELITTQDHQPIDTIGLKGYVDRVGTRGKSGSIVREGSLAQYKADPTFVSHVTHSLPLLQLWDSPYPSLKEQEAKAAKDPKAPRAFANPHAWGMTLDMSACTGCNACVIACQSENNIPVVGKGMVKMNREMHWIRIDRYFKAAMNADRSVVNEDYENVDVTYQVMMCVHCENAPCEQVCPVAATVHDTEGLNTMVYNRCIGTRYCSNNCPYKVRRFNYMDWHSRNPRRGTGLELIASAWIGIPDTQQQNEVEQVRRMVYNPEVTVRMRGVMEKCTYCSQRIKAATIKKKNKWAQGKLPQEDKANGLPAYTVDDLEILTACQQACPTQAITFGDLNDPGSLVRGRQELPRAYTVLEDLNTRARSKHLARIQNPSEQLAVAEPPKAAGGH